MNQILHNRGMLLTYENEGFIAELMVQKDGVNTIWGQEYIMMNGKSFMNNIEEIIKIMMKCKNLSAD